MAIGTGVDATPIMICPGCGYPRLGEGLCAACVPTAALAPVDSTMITVARGSNVHPAA
jgi:hypothetical protein